jgi:hypothetical protein
VAGAAVLLWLAMLSARKSVERRLVRGEPSTTKSIWTRDLLDNRFGHVVRSMVFPPVLIGLGLIDVLTAEARWKGFDYHGFDAVCIGVGTTSIGVALLAIYTFPASDTEGDRFRGRIIVGAGVLFAVCFGTALFRNF